MALSPDQKFSTFTDGGDLQVGDTIVGLRGGVNTRFLFPSTLPSGIIVPISQGGTGATTASGARTNLGLGTIATQDSNNISVTGGSMSNVLVPTPTAGTEIANKDYVDGVAAGISYYLPARLASTANFAATYNPGASGVGATLTATSVGAASFDGVTPSAGNLVLLKNQTNTFENGLYVVTTVGDGATAAVLTRSTLYDTPGKINFGDTFGVVDGNTLSGTFWQQDVAVATVGTDPITYQSQNVVDLTSTQTISGDKSFTGALSANSISFTSTAEIIGTTTNNNADAGSVGELISSNVPSGSAVGVLNNTAFNITSIVLTPGDWDVWGTVQLLPDVTTTTSQLIGWTSTTSATLVIPPNQGSWHQITGISVPAGTAIGLSTGTRRYSVAVNTTVYLSTFVTFATSTMAAYGYIAARRRR